MWRANWATRSASPPRGRRTPEAEAELAAAELKAELDAFRAQSVVLNLGLQATTDALKVTPN
ncbi:hypothetical protein ACTD5D_18355 [Nocardia takedensis]|uniref:hypothetical protein n=1 Tax=Nocardia takedensis TaxID=259390 RepID=UPI0002E80864|nr:hypothetical protein [Nocardia takedensis]